MTSFQSAHSIVRPLSAALVAVAAWAAPAAHAQTAPAAPASGASQPGHGYGHHHHGGAWLKAIGATAAQQASIKAILAQAHTQVQALRTSAGNPRQQLAKVLAAPTVDPTAAATAQQAIQSLQSSISSVMLQAQLQIAGVLTPAQRAQLYSMRQAMAERWKARGG